MTHTNKFKYLWNLSDKFNVPGVTKHSKKVFSCFSGGGGSSMGYKLAGYDVIGCCEIDKYMLTPYIKNLNPKYPYCTPIQELKSKASLPKELFELDILDGSPPCSTFSMAGLREDAWGKSKKIS